MNKKEYNYNGISVTVVKTDKFKSIIGMLCFKTPIKKEMMVTRRLIRSLLMHSCKKYPTAKELSINTLKNYGAFYQGATIREGNYMINKFLFRILEDKYTQKGNFDKSVDTFKEIIFNPNVTNKEFNEEEFDLFYQTMKSEIESEIERPRNYAIDKLCGQMGIDSVITYKPTIEQLEKVTSKSLYEGYLDMIENSEKEFIIAGNIEDDALDNCVKKLLENLSQKKYNVPLIVKNDLISNKLNSKVENYNGKQSILTLGLKLGEISDFERLYVVPIYSGILGGGASSRLFNVVREKNSLAYFCFSRYERDDSMIAIISGIEKDNYDKTLNLIKEVVEKMNSVSEEEISRVKEEIISSLKESDDYLQNYPQRIYNGKLYEILSNEEKIENIKKVTKKDVEAIYNKIFLTDSYFLKGVKTDGKDKD